MSSCIFCKIANKEIPSKLVYEDDKIIAFEDINPVRPVHILIVPKEHVESVSHIDNSNASIISDIHLAANKIANIKNCKSFRMITNSGKEAGQSVFHLHYHFLSGGELVNLL